METDTLTRIKRAVLAGRYILTDKANTELDADGLSILDVIEAVVDAGRIRKSIRSTRPSGPGRRDRLYVILGRNLSGTAIYSKGKLSATEDGEVWYVLISAKRAL